MVIIFNLLVERMKNDRPDFSLTKDKEILNTFESRKAKSAYASGLFKISRTIIKNKTLTKNPQGCFFSPFSATIDI
ncbi:hypothetical protein ABE50_17775 [Bacillus wiedmannii]|nr:hypothetical protein [Bacillus wiedmannii]